MDPTQQSGLGQADVLIQLWWFVLGAVVGSFLNVVIHRLPRGKSLVWPGSHCPVCQNPIRWYDNVPVLSWFLLRGRCRDCGTAISLRYPVIEFLAGVITGSVAWALRPASWLAGLSGDPGGSLAVIIVAVQTLAVAGFLLTILVVAAILWDRQAVPLPVWIPAAALVISAALLSDVFVATGGQRLFAPGAQGMTDWALLVACLILGLLAEGLGRLHLRQLGQRSVPEALPKTSDGSSLKTGQKDRAKSPVSPSGHDNPARIPDGNDGQSVDWLMGVVLCAVIWPPMTALLLAVAAVAEQGLACLIWAFQQRGDESGRKAASSPEGWRRTRGVLLALWGILNWACLFVV